MIFKNKGSLPPKRAMRINPTMSIFGTKSALTSNPPTHRLTLRPQGIVSTGSQPLISWSIKKESTLSSSDDTRLPEVYTDTVACIYNVDGKCKGMLTPERLNIVQKAFNRAKCSGLHDHVQPPIRLASELVGLIACKDTSASKHMNKKTKDSFARILPSHITAAFQKWALVFKERMASPLDYDPNFAPPLLE
jgi:hypothetical protein